MTKLIDFSKFPSGTEFTITTTYNDRRVEGQTVVLLRSERAPEYLQGVEGSSFTWAETRFVKNSTRYEDQTALLYHYWMEVEPVKKVKRKVV